MKQITFRPYVCFLFSTVIVRINEKLALLHISSMLQFIINSISRPSLQSVSCVSGMFPFSNKSFSSMWFFGVWSDHLRRWNNGWECIELWPNPTYMDMILNLRPKQYKLILIGLWHTFYEVRVISTRMWNLVSALRSKKLFEKFLGRTD